MSGSTLVRLSGPEPQRPLLITGLGSAAVLSGSGDLALTWEARGAAIEWGGVYAQGVRLSGPWRSRVRVLGESFDVPGTLLQLEASRWKIESTHRFGPLLGRQQIVAPAETHGILRRWEFSNPTPAPLEVVVTSEWSPYLSPVIVEAFKPYEYKVGREGGSLRFISGSYAVVYDASPTPESWLINGHPWDGNAAEGEVGSVSHDTDLALPPGGTASVASVLWGGLGKSVKASPTVGLVELGRSGAWETEAATPWERWLESTPKLALPGSPSLEKAYGLACSALRALYTRPEPTLFGLVAGYPWYSTIWCRDLAWTLPAVLWMGDFDWAGRAVESVLRFQAPESILILSAEKGELPMQLSAGPVFIYGTSDTTHHYPDLVRRLLEHSGDVARVRQFYPAVERAVHWGEARRDAATGLVRNGGELERMMALAKMTGRFEYGIDAHDTTIWDSVDRRDHAIDVQVLWHRSLDAFRRLAEVAGEGEKVRWATEERARLGESIRSRYWWPEERYCFDSLHFDGSPVRTLRPNALRTIALGIWPGETAQQLLERALRPDLRSAWGMRTLSTSDPAYIPTSYHDGQVWTIATAWAAEASFASGNAAAGAELMETIADRILNESGLANECYRGDRPDAFNSCFLLGFSIGPFLTNLFEGLWGLMPMDAARTLRVEPRMPEGWTEARLTGVRIGPGTVDLEWSPDHLTALWSGPGTLALLTPGGPTELTPGSPARVPLRAPTKKS